MSALYRVRPHIRLARVRSLTPPSRRFHIQNICDGFLDLALALPIPPTVPAYSTTIILVTLLSRFALLPISIWVRPRKLFKTFLRLKTGKTTRTKSGRDRNARNRKAQTHHRKTSL